MYMYVYVYIYIYIYIGSRAPSGPREWSPGTPASPFGAKYYTPEISKVTIHWNTPLKVHWTIPVNIHWTSDNPLDNIQVLLLLR